MKIKGTIVAFAALLFAVIPALAQNNPTTKVITTGTRFVSLSGPLPTVDAIVNCDATNGPVVLSLPLAKGSGDWVYVEKTDSTTNACTVVRSDGDSIDGKTSLSVSSQYQVIELADRNLGNWGNASSSGAGSPPCTTVTGTTTSTLTPASPGSPVTECHNLVLSASNTTTTFSSAAAPVIGWTDHFFVTQPAGGNNYTFSLAAGSGVNLVYTPGCSVAPTMPTGAGHALIFTLIFNNNPTTPEVDVVSCIATGA